MVSPRRLLACLLLTLLCLPARLPAEIAPGRSSLGIRFGDRLAEGYLDLIVPVAGGANDLLFFNPRFGLGDEAANELNLGLGFRHAFSAQGLFGANVYFDSRRTIHDNRFSQVGAGLELLSTWVDLRGNYYWPVDDKQVAETEVREGTQVVVTENTTVTYDAFGDPYALESEIVQTVDVTVHTSVETTTTTTTKTFEDWESAREGFDAEAGVRLPLFGSAAASATPALRLFAGYYHFEDEFDAVLAGAKGRLEFRALPYLTFDVEFYEDQELYGSRTIAGARLHTPFDLAALVKGRNPFPAAAPATRMNEMVMRDIRVQTDTSGLRENEGLRQVAVNSTTEATQESLRRQYILLDDVVFVDGENVGDPGQTGTAEHPFSVIQEGANNVFGLRNMYVFAASANYVENVVLQEGTTMIGQGTGILGLGGRVFGGDAYTGVTPSTPDPVVTLASNTKITGFEIGQGLLGIAGIAGVGVSGAIDITNNIVSGGALADIVVVTSGDAAVTIAGNAVEGGMIGIGLLNMGGALTAAVNGNHVGDTLLGIGAANLGVMATSDLPGFAPLADIGAAAVAAGPATTNLVVGGNGVDDSLAGIAVANVGAGTMNATIDGNTVQEALVGIVGVNLDPATLGAIIPQAALPSGALTFTATRNFVSNSSADGMLGIGVVNAGAGTTIADIGTAGAGNTVNGFTLGIGAGNVGGALGLPVPIAIGPSAPPTLDARIVGNFVTRASEIGIGAGALGNPATAILIDSNTVEAGGYGIGIGSVDTFGSLFAPFDVPAADSGDAAPLKSAGYLDATVSNNRIVADNLAGVGIFGSGNTTQSVALLGNEISGPVGVYAWTEEYARLRVMLQNCSVNATSGPGILAETHNHSLLLLEGAGNTISSSQAEGLRLGSYGNSRLLAQLENNTIAGYDTAVFARGRNLSNLVLTAGGNAVASTVGKGFVLKSHGSSSVSGELTGNAIDAADAEIRAHLFDTGALTLNATANVGADDTFRIRLIDDGMGGTFTHTELNNVDANGLAAVVVGP